MLVHAVGMHARPAVKLTKLAKRFSARIAVRVAGAADWIDAKSVARVMACAPRPKASSNSKRAAPTRGPRSTRSSPWSRRLSRYGGVISVPSAAHSVLKGKTASPGYARGPIVRAGVSPQGRRRPGADEAGAIRAALAVASRQIATLANDAGEGRRRHPRIPAGAAG